MDQLVIRDLEDDVKERLQRRAEKHGRSMEAKVLDILRSAVAEQAMLTQPLGTRVAGRFKNIGLDAPIKELRGWDVRVPDFSE